MGGLIGAEGVVEQAAYQRVVDDIGVRRRAADAHVHRCQRFAQRQAGVQFGDRDFGSPRRRIANIFIGDGNAVAVDAIAEIARLAFVIVDR